MRERPQDPREAAEELEEFFDLSLDILCVVGFDGYFKRVNPALERAFGYPRAELFSRSVLDMTHPDDVEAARAALGRLAAGEDLVGFVTRVVRGDGAVREIEWNTQTAPERGVVYGVGRDATERRRADAELREAQDLLRASRDELRVLADEQQALRRVAELVASGAPDAEVFDAAVRETTAVVGCAFALLVRFDPDDMVTTVAVHDTPPVYRAGQRQPAGNGVVGEVQRTGRSAQMTRAGAPGLDRFIADRVDALGIVAAAGAPIRAEDCLWGVLLAFSESEALPEGTQARLEGFARLVGTAIAAADARRKVHRLADEQGALRRVATLVAREASPEALFAAVAREVGEVLGVNATHVGRFDPDGTVVSVAQWGRNEGVPLGARFALEGDSVSARVHRTGRVARIDDYQGTPGVIAATLRDLGIRACVGAPISVEGRPWGVMIASSEQPGGFSADVESRLGDFTDLLATAIANADSRDQLRRSRARVLASADAARRRVVADLHDGAQQRLVQAVVTLKLAQRDLREDPGRVEGLVAEALQAAEQGMVELRELAHGILPSGLTHGGLRAGIDAFVARLDLHVDVDVVGERLPPEIEASAYFIVAEALTNVSKHARATAATVRAALADGALALEVRDDGVGGADPDGHGLTGIADRVHALGGRLRLESAPGCGTAVLADLPVAPR